MSVIRAQFYISIITIFFQNALISLQLYEKSKILYFVLLHIRQWYFTTNRGIL